MNLSFRMSIVLYNDSPSYHGQHFQRHWEKLARVIALRSAGGAASGRTAVLEDLGLVVPLDQVLKDIAERQLGAVIDPGPYRSIDGATKTFTGATGIAGGTRIAGAGGAFATAFGAGIVGLSTYGTVRGVDKLINHKVCGTVADYVCLLDLVAGGSCVF